jgi:hypothetical protein
MTRHDHADLTDGIGQVPGVTAADRAAALRLLARLHATDVAAALGLDEEATADTTSGRTH